MNVLEAVEHEFLKTLDGRHEIRDRLWILGESKRGSGFHIDLWVSECPGGAYSAFGTLALDDGCIILQLKTVWGIIRCQSRHSTHKFEFCDPDFPNNVVCLIYAAATNANKVFRLAHSRHWAHYRRKTRLASS